MIKLDIVALEEGCLGYVVGGEACGVLWMQCGGC